MLNNKTAYDARRALSDLSLAVLKNPGDAFLEQLQGDLQAFVELLNGKIAERKAGVSETFPEKFEECRVAVGQLLFDELRRQHPQRGMHELSAAAHALSHEVLKNTLIPPVFK